MAERKTLSLGSLDQQTSRGAAEAARAWNVSPKRAAALKERARSNRREPSEAQKLLWSRMADKQLGFTFNREVVMGSTIVDFACKSRWLVVEVGGTGEGSQATLAALSDRKLTEVGVRVLRFSEAQIFEDVDGVVEAIRAALSEPFEKPRFAAEGDAV